MSIPDGAHALDLRGDALAFALSVGGSEEIHDLAGRLAPPIPGHESETLRSVRALSGSMIWACVDRGVASWDGTAWTFHDLFALSLRDLDTAGTCAGLDARSSTDAYVSIGRSVCLWDGFEWDCHQFVSPTGGVALTGSYLWFVQSSASWDDLTVIDTVSLATPALVRLGPTGSTAHVLPIPGDDRVVVTQRFPETSAPCDACNARSVDVDGNLVDQGAPFVVPISPDERFALRVSASAPLACGGGLFPSCGEGAAWSDLAVLRVTGAEEREVGHLTRTDLGAVPAWAFRDGSGLFVPGDALYALP